jgi:hypothetical protein
MAVWFFSCQEGWVLDSAETVDGAMPNQARVSSVKAKPQRDGNRLAIVKLPERKFINYNPCKPISIYQHIGVRHVISFGNLEGDSGILEYDGFRGQV